MRRDFGLDGNLQPLNVRCEALCAPSFAVAVPKSKSSRPLNVSIASMFPAIRLPGDRLEPKPSPMHPGCGFSAVSVRWTTARSPR
jgi:hypothetical protein